MGRDAAGDEVVVIKSNSATGTSATQSQGTSASGATDDGSNPVKVGGRFNTTQPTLTDGQRGDLQMTNRGGVIVQLYSGNTNVTSTFDSSSDGNTVGGFRLGVGSMTMLYNGSTYDRSRTPNVFKTQSAVTITSETTVWTPTGGKKFRLMGGVVTLSANGNITFKDNTAGTIILVVPCLAGAPVSLAAMGNGILSAAANNVLTATGSVAGTLSGTLFGTEE